MVVVSLLDKTPQTAILNMEKIEEKALPRIVLILWGVAYRNYDRALYLLMP